MWRRIAIGSAGIVLCLGGFLFAQAGAATTVVSASGGSVTFSAVVRSAKTCRWSSSPKIAGFAVTERCKMGIIFRVAKFRANTSAKAKAYAIRLTVHGTITEIDHWKVVQAGGNRSTTTTTTVPPTTTTTVPPTTTTTIPAQTYFWAKITGGAVNERSGPGTSYSVVGLLPNGSTIEIACQTSGSLVITNSVWDQLNNGSYISDYYTTTPVPNNFSPQIPRCASSPSGGGGGSVSSEVAYWLGHITQSWGTNEGGSNYEEGVDISMPTDTPVLAVQGGTVLATGTYGGGGVVSISVNGIAEYYQHLDCISVSSGQSISAGQQIGTSGGQLSGGSCGRISSSTFSTGPHIEFGIDATYGAFWNPEHWSPNRNPLPLLQSL